VPFTGRIASKATTRGHAAASARFHFDARISGRVVFSVVVAIENSFGPAE
jgi:hypothetical protein